MILMNPTATHKWPQRSRYPRLGRSSIVFTFVSIIFAANLGMYALPTFAAAALVESQVKIPKIDREGVEGHGGGKYPLLLLEQLGGEGKDGQSDQDSRVNGGLLKDVTVPYGKPKEDLEDGGWLGDEQVEVDAMEKEELSDGEGRGTFHTSFLAGTTRSMGEMKDEVEDHGMKVDKEDGKDKVHYNRSAEGKTETGLNGSSSFTLADDMNRLKDVSRHLRGGTGGGSKETDSAVIFSEVKDIAKSYLGNMMSIQKQYQDKDNEDNVSSIKSIIGDMGTFAEASKEFKEISGKDFPNSFNIISGDDSFNLDGIPDSQLVEPKVFNQLVELSQDLVGVLEGIDVSIFTSIGDDISQETFAQDEVFAFDFDSFESDPFQNTQSSSYRSSGQRRPHFHDFFSSPTFINILRSQKSGLGSRFSSPKLRKFASFLDDDMVSAEHELYLNALGNVCPRCSETDLACNCGNLYSCVDNMTEYDLAVLIAGGYVDTNPMGNSFANFTVSTKNLYLFDADEGVRAKLERVKILARGDSVDMTSCKAVLEEFSSVCNPLEKKCDTANQQAFQVSIDQVCDAVNTPTKLLFEVIGDEFDGFTDEFADAECTPLSYDMCREFVTEFDRLYDGRDIGKYPLYNPMRKDPTITLHALAHNGVFDQVQFPVGYVFRRDERGVVTREFADPDLEKRQLFSLVNPSDGRALGVEGSCADPNLELQAHDRSDPRQQFSLGNNGTLISKECPTKLLTSGSLECIKEIDLVLMDASSRRYAQTNRHQTQQWRFHSDGSIRNIQCPNSVISTLKDNSWKGKSEKISFSILNPLHGDAMAVEEGDCKDGLNIVVQQSDPDDLSQQFFFGKDGEIFSMKCSGKVLDIYLGRTSSCENGRNIHLWESNNSDNQKWRTTLNGELESIRCKDHMIAIEEGGRAGSNIILWHKTDENDQRWTFDVQSLDQLDGPFSIVNSANSMAITVRGCYDGLLELQPYALSNNLQRFYLGGDGVIVSAECKGKVISNSDISPCSGESSTRIKLANRMNRDDQQWTLDNGQIRSVNCANSAISISGGRGMVPGQDNAGSFIGLRTSGADWDQQWDEKSNNVRLLGGSPNSQQTTWRAEFVEPNYDYALIPGFPGILEDGCYSSTKDTQLAKDAMHSCDKSMSLLIGSQTSVGTLRAIAKLVEKNGPEQMPGYCCMDNAANSQHFGYDYDPKSDNSTMKCQNHGPWHLGISPIACENGGGQWFRNPCTVLQDCIDARPVNGTDEFSQAFEKFAKELVINDASDESQCGLARQELGFTANHPYDTDVCRQFSEEMCDTEIFSQIDRLTEGLDGNNGWTHIKYESPKYPEDDKLTFVELRERSDFITPDDVGTYTPQLTKLKNAALSMQYILLVMTIFHDHFLFHIKATCDAVDTVMSCNVPNPANIACIAQFLILHTIMHYLKMAASVANEMMDTAYDESQLKDGEKTDMYLYSKFTSENFKEFDQWNNDALGIINKNIVTQHHEMREDLQTRHTEMGDCITCKTVNAMNTLGCKMEEYTGGDKCVGGDIPNGCDRTACPQSKLDLNVQWPQGQSNLLETLKQVEMTENHIQEAVKGIQNALVVGTGGDSSNEVDKIMRMIDAHRKITKLMKDNVDGIEAEMMQMKDEMLKLIEQNNALLEMMVNAK